MTEDIAPAEKTTTALAVCGQLEEAQERLTEAQKAYENDHGVARVTIGLYSAIAGSLLLSAFLVGPLSPIAGIVGAVCLAGGGTSFGIGVHINNKVGKNLKTARTNEEGRREVLRGAAESALTRGVGAYAVGQELRVDVADETPKILRIEAVGTELDNEDRQAQKISAQLYETVAQADGGLKRGKRIAKIPTITCSMLLKSPLPGLSVEVAGLAPSPPTRGATEKKLPPCTLV